MHVSLFVNIAQSDLCAYLVKILVIFYCKYYMTTNSFRMRAPTSVAEATRKQNYVVKNNLAYTEDNVLVHNIFLYYLPKECTEEDVRSYFTQFGEVVRVRVMPGQQRSHSLENKLGFVHFKDALNACKALLENNHRIQECRIGVSAADSWNQPDADNFIQMGRYHGHSDEKNEQQDAPNTSSEPPSNALTVLSLNYDCLEMICGLMELRDQVNFARVCPRFNDVFKMFCKRKYKAIDLNKSFYLLKMSSMTLWEIRDFFRFSGEYIEEVTINSKENNRKRITEFIRLFCKNLKRITLSDIELQPDALNKLLRSFPKLGELRLLCRFVNDTTVKSLLHLKNLDALIIHVNSRVTGKFLSALTQLKKLSLYGCEYIQTKYLIQICKAMKNLKSLDVRGCKRLTSAFIKPMTVHCLELEVLKMPCPTFSFDCVARLPCLKDLELLGRPTFDGTILITLLTGLGAHKADQLERLKIVASLTVDHFTAISKLKQLKIFYCDSNNPIGDEALRKLNKLELLEELVIKSADDITNEALLILLQNCTRLHLLNIEYCKKISTKFIAEAVDMLKSRRAESKKPLTIFVRFTSIDQFALAVCPIYESALKSGIIKVVFHPYESDKDYYGCVIVERAKMPLNFFFK